MSIIGKAKRALRGEVDARTVALEAWRRASVRFERRRERAGLDELDRQPARLRSDFARLSQIELLSHFRERSTPKFFPGFESNVEKIAELQKRLFPSETAQLIESGARISQKHRWPLLGYGERDFGARVEWLRDPVSGEEWAADYHADLNLALEGYDVRVLWELNRLAHLITLGCAYSITHDEQLAADFFAQLDGWRVDNAVGRGPNWACAMEVALRAMNLLAAFRLFLPSPSLTPERLQQLLAMFEQHGAHIQRNLEFSYIATSNHYLSDVVGLLWLGIMLPELSEAKRWREFGLREMLKEMNAQVLEDGADAESSTGYHRLVLELFLYSFLLCRANAIEIPEKYWHKLRAMLDYMRAYLRPDGRAPLIGDTDSGQVLPLVKRAANDHAYVLALGAAIFNEPRFKLSDDEAMPEEVLWILGEEGVRVYKSLEVAREGVASHEGEADEASPSCEASQAFPSAGVYIMREGDLYLLLNASGSGLNGRGSHGHNDVLSLEVSACGVSFITDPGTYVYRTDLHERHLFRSTAYHSTVQVDDAEQNTINESVPFVIGDEARPRVLVWETTPARDFLIAEHNGYARLQHPVTHRRAVEFDKRERFWLIEDELACAGEHVYSFRFQLAPGLETEIQAAGIVSVCDKMTGARLLIASLDVKEPPQLEPRWTSSDYGAKIRNTSLCWTLLAHAPVKARWALVPVCAGEEETARIKIIEHLS